MQHLTKCTSSKSSKIRLDKLKSILADLTAASANMQSKVDAKQVQLDKLENQICKLFMLIHKNSIFIKLNLDFYSLYCPSRKRVHIQTS